MNEMERLVLPVFLGLLCFGGGNSLEQGSARKRQVPFSVFQDQLAQQLSNTSIPASVWQNIMSQSTAVDVLQTMLGPPINATDDPWERILFPTTANVEPDPEGAVFVGSLLANNAGCTPYLQAVAIPEDVNKPRDPNEVFWPPCTPVEQCGGCCGLDYLECVKTKVKIITVMVLTARYPYPGADRFTYTGIVPKTVEKHEACTCRCRVQLIDCDSQLHDYLEDSCRCKCKNEELATTCAMNKKWSESRCRCECLVHDKCYEGEVFNSERCSCEAKAGGDGFPDYGAAIPPGEHHPCFSRSCIEGREPVPFGDECRCMLSSQGVGFRKPGDQPNELTKTTTTARPFRGRGRNRGIRGSEQVEHRSVKDGHVPMIVGKK